MVVTVPEFDAMSPADRQTTIQNLMGSDPQNAQILMIRERELAGLNTSNPTVMNPTQAAQIQEVQTQNAQVYQEYQAQQAAQQAQASIVNAPQQSPVQVMELQPSSYWNTEAQVQKLVNNEPMMPKSAIQLVAPAGREIVPESIVGTPTSVEYMTRPISQPVAQVQTPDILGSIFNQATNPLGISPGFLPSLERAKKDFTKESIRQIIKIGGVASFGLAPAIAGVGSLVSPLISQGFKSVQGGGLLTQEEFQDAFFGGAAFSVLGAGANQALRLTGPGLKAAAGRVGTNALLGAGVGSIYEYAETKQVTGKGALEGAAFGAGLGLAGELATGGYGKVVRPKLTESISKSYEKTLTSGELWKPSLTQQATMKLTGVRPNSPELKVKATDLLSESYKKQAELNESILLGKPMPENIKGRTGLTPWSPTVKESEMIRLVGVNPKTPAPSINTARISAEEMFSFSGLKRQMIADDLFDFSVAPKTSFRTEIMPMIEKPMNFKPSSRLPFLAASSDVYGFKNDLKRMEQSDLEKQMLLDKSTGRRPESLLDYDYKGPLSFKRPKIIEQPKPKVSKSPIEIVSKKNISTFDALKMAKDIAKQGKPVSQLRYGAAFGDSRLRGSQKSMFMQRSGLISGAPKQEMVLGFSTRASTRSGNNPFSSFAGRSYYPKGVNEDYETTFLTMPGQVSRLKPAADQPKASFSILFGSISSSQNQENNRIDFASGTQQKIETTPKIIIGQLPDIFIPNPTIEAHPEPVIGHLPRIIIPNPTPTKNIFNFPGSKYEGRGPDMFFGARGRGKRSALRIYPVTDPKKLLRSTL